ncbi:MAG: FHA domain-containing protein, partial [Anaerolineae bacterium]|nr:FHA domain-containing protein [Anaerolineae bacterium]
MAENQKSEHPAIVILDGELKSHAWLLDQEHQVLGRDEECDIVIPMRQISRQHVAFHRSEDGVVLEDLQSRNGTWVNGNRLEGHIKLSDGDEIHIALRVRL